MSELVRIVDIGAIDARPVTVAASPQECAALAARFGLVAVDELIAVVALDRDGMVVAANGTLNARIVQSCAVSAEDLAVAIDEPLHLRFVPAAHARAEAAEITADECDEIEYHGQRFDLGEAVAQSLGLAIDPFRCGPEAEAARARLQSAEEAGPFAALKGLRGG